MFTVYYSNQLENQKDLLVGILTKDPNPNPFEQEIVLVQSLGMAQWLQMQIAKDLSVAGNFQFPYPTSFLWQQYRLLFPDLPKENIFERSGIVWRLMRLIPQLLERKEFAPLNAYLVQQDSLKRFQLAAKIADLFDQYLVYRPHWLVHWEKNEQQQVLDEITRFVSFKRKNQDDIAANIEWQSLLWNTLVADIKQDSDEIIFNTSHRAYLQQRYFEKLDNLTVSDRAKLPKRIFIFGISSLPATQLAVFKKLSEHCNIHLFFTNPSEMFWGDNREDNVLEKLALSQQLSAEELDGLLEQQGNPLLMTWGKQGKEFLNLLTELDPKEISLYDHFSNDDSSLLTQLKGTILRFEAHPILELNEGDTSLQIHSCHSKMREVEVLHNHLLQLFEQNTHLSPKDIIVMSADIDSYAPYIQAVFARYERQDPRFIPFTLSDQKISYVNPIVASFLRLLSMKERKISVDEVLDLFDIRAIREQYQLSEESIFTLREWVNTAGIRAGLHTENSLWKNYNSWENGINRLLLGTSLTEKNNSWQDILAFDESYGLASVQSGYLAKFLQDLTAWSDFLSAPQSLGDWQQKLTEFIKQLYVEDEESADTLFNLHQAVDTIFSQIKQAKFDQPLEAEIVAQLFEQQLSEQRSNLNFLIGKVNFCTLLPMRAIPFKVICLLGMNEGEFPRQQTLNSFDLMQYAPQKGDRARRDDDRYLFLEALLSAQQQFYISYLGQSLTDSQEKLPSVLVSQLYDYIQQHLDDPENAKQLLTLHPMTVFSPENFIHGKVAYDKEWLAVMEERSEQSGNFLTPLEREDSELPTEIDLADLIAYIQNPLRFFFQRQLGIRFEQDDSVIAESEVFSLSPLERYQLLDQLIDVKKDESENFFKNAKLKGKLPACYFGELAQNELSETIQPLRSVLKVYQDEPSELIEIDQQYQLENSQIRLVGHIRNRFGNEVVLWRVGDLRDKDRIQMWLYYLALKATENSAQQLHFHYRKGDSAKLFGFNDISRDEAQQQLSIYLQDYLTGYRVATWAITDDLESYFQKLNEETSWQELCRTAIESSKDIYLQRVLTQTRELSVDDIHQRTLRWFEKMMKTIKDNQ
ncbi:exodeoxyribonuclease V subunit gamma [Glaesserella sp.]|uniref:exodeoxyribonuclease V subunit gamma n=1 Tax=Glaesserella sp. TaxID=2094731 RepID=UPI0035A0DA14